MARLPPRPDWSRPLPRPIVIPTVLQLTTLADVRSLIERHLASNRRVVPTWRYVRQKLDEAARGGDAMDLAVALQIALIGGRRMPSRGRAGFRRPRRPRTSAVFQRSRRQPGLHNATTDPPEKIGAGRIAS
jgi:hypothetical protein